MREIVFAFPGATATAPAAAALAAAVSELCLVAGAMAASFYLGAVIRCFLSAAVTTQGPRVLGSLTGLFLDLKAKLGMSVDDFLRMATSKYPPLSSIKSSVHLAARVPTFVGARYA
jgi:hypothetical protein